MPERTDLPLFHIVDFDCEGCGEESMWVRKTEPTEQEIADAIWLCNECRGLLT